MTSYFRSRWSGIDEVWQFYAEFYADYSDVVKVETGRRISICRTFVFVKRKQLYLGGRLIYPDDIRCADRLTFYLLKKVTSPSPKPEVKLGHSGRHLKQELSYRKQIARQLRSQYVEGIYRSNYP